MHEQLLLVLSIYLRCFWKNIEYTHMTSASLLVALLGGVMIGSAIGIVLGMYTFVLDKVSVIGTAK